MGTFIFFFVDGKKEKGEGETPADAFTNLGYGSGAISAVDFFVDTSDTSYGSKKESDYFFSEKQGWTSNHYDWLEENLNDFWLKVKGVSLSDDWAGGIIGAHGDKGYQYKFIWEKEGVPFFHGMAIYLLTYTKPYADEVRKTDNGWVPVERWVIDNYKHGHNFSQYFE